jgi:hydroxyacylglutathione hydrolase
MKLTSKIHLLQIDFEITISSEKKLPRFVNVIVIFGKEITLVDTGVKGSEKGIFEYIKNQDRDISEIKTIILSHSHPDHIGSAAMIKELTNCKIYSHESEKEWIENIDIQNKNRPVPGFYNLVDKSAKIDGYISDNQILSIDEDVTIKFIKSSGHSKGSLNMEFLEDKILFTADSIPLKNDIPNYDNYFELMDSLEVISRSKNIKILLTSWTPPFFKKEDIERLIKEGKEYMKFIDSVVQGCYKDKNTPALDYCKEAVSKIGLPPFLVTPLVDKAFKSHIK